MYSVDRGDLTDRGFLSDPEHWSSEVASALAEAEGIELTDTHWVVLEAIRDFYAENQVPMTYHVLCPVLEDALRPDKHNCIHAMKQLFPQGGIKQASRIAGVPDHFCFGC